MSHESGPFPGLLRHGVGDGALGLRQLAISAAFSGAGSGTNSSIWVAGVCQLFKFLIGFNISSLISLSIVFLYLGCPNRGSFER